MMKCCFWMLLVSLLRVSSALEAGFSGDPDAQTFHINIPGPRGVITDRNGKILAGNQVREIPAIDFRAYDEAAHGSLTKWGQAIVTLVNETLGTSFSVKDQEIESHFESRRWLTFPFGSYLSEEQYEELKRIEGAGLTFLKVYSRDYPHGEVAAHILGYVGAESRYQRGAILNEANIWPNEEGRAGIEKYFDDFLIGKPGVKDLVYNGEGELLVNRYLERPRTGGAIVTTLNLDWQIKADAILKKLSKKGAFVVVDVETGEILVMSSNPSYNPNLFVPRISTESYSRLRDDPNKPFLPRAYVASYPPASTFKPFVALAALELGSVTADTMIDCGVSYDVGNLTFKNWSQYPEGEINAERALARSCNTWFYPVGVEMGARSFLSIARGFGFGQRPELPLSGVAGGYCPTESEHVKRFGFGFSQGDAANFSIGQGTLLASPLQVAHSMAGCCLSWLW